jgi:4-amino-4-deoxy-L-arabinose transferase-like glycosyltransferase
MQQEQRAHRQFVTLWLLVTAVKFVIAARVPLFVDEAFYWQEGRHLAPAYSDLPGMTAWLVRLGTAIGGQHVLALRAPFLLLMALLPWLLAQIAGRWHGEVAGWRTGMLVLLMPLMGTLGILALPDVPMMFATVLCLDAGARLLREVDAASVLELVAGLMIGALSHYRFAGVIGVGFIALSWSPEGRRVLRDPRIWIALCAGLAAWAPLLIWNVANAEAGLRFQLLDRHPWAFQSAGFLFPAIQALLSTPLLFIAMIWAALAAFGNRDMPLQARWFGLLGGISTLSYFALGFFADTERVSFHWPLPGYLALLIAVPALLASWPRGWRIATWVLAGLGLGLVLGFYLMVTVPAWRMGLAFSRFYPADFVGWGELTAAVREELAQMPPGSKLLAGNFKPGSALGFVLDNADIAVLPHPLNDAHGRSPQLRLWGLQSDGSRNAATLLVVGENEVKYSSLLSYYHTLCDRVGPLPPPRVVNIDHGARRFLLFRLPAQKSEGVCVLPAFAWLDHPAPGARAGRMFEVSGWAFKDGVGLQRVEVLLDGKPLAEARYGSDVPHVAAYWKISTDPNHPRVGFQAQVTLPGDMANGQHWLGLRLHGNDGSVENWAEQTIEFDPAVK